MYNKLKKNTTVSWVCVIVYVIVCTCLELYFKKILLFIIEYSVYLTWQIYICIHINITLLLEKTKEQLEMNNSETLTTLRTQEIGWTMIDIALHRNTHNNTDDNASDTKEKTVLAQLAVPVVSLLNNTNIICKENRNNC